MFGRILGWYTIYTFSKALARWQNFARRPAFAFSYIGSVTVRHCTSEHGQALQHGTRNGIMELSLRAPSIFGWAAIMLGIGPHSS